MSLPIVAIVGISGAIGTSVVEALLSPLYRNKVSFPIRIVTRDVANAQAVPVIAASPESFQLYTGNVATGEGLQEAFTGATVVVNLVGVTTFSHNAVVDAAAAAGVKVYVPSEFGSDPAAGDKGKFKPVFSLKTQNAEYALTKPFKSVFISAGLFTEHAFSIPGLGGFISETEFKTFSPDAEYGTTSVPDIGRTVAAIAAKSADPSSLPTSVALRGDVLTGKKLADIYSKYSGKELKFTRGPASEIIGPADEILAAGGAKSTKEFFVVLTAFLTQGFGNVKPNYEAVVGDDFKLETTEDVAKRLFKQ